MNYEIIYEPVIIENTERPKYNIKYYGGEYDGLKEFHSIDGINGTIRNGYRDKNAPNYYGLEQSLFKSSLFEKYLNDYNTKGTIFQATLQNGKDGRDVDQEHLLLGFAAMKINFTQEDVDSINSKLQENNFRIRLKIAG